MISPLRFGTDQQFAALQGLLRDAGFNDAAVCSRAQVPTIFDVLMSEIRRAHKPPLEDTLDAMMWVLLEGRALSMRSWEALVSGEITGLLRDMGLLVEQGGEYICTLALYPVEDIYVVSDRNAEIPDRVYPALVENVQRFLQIIPRSRCESFLEVCSGTGIAALVAARDFARKSYAFDIADRSVQFAEFNRRLNGLENMTNTAGDLYGPANGKMFDRIVAHPPYVPVLKPNAIYSDGGDDGEQIVKRIVEGLPAHLAPGGEFAMLSMGSDRNSGTYEYRVREWLGEAHAEFDIALVRRKAMEPADFVARSIMRGKTEASEVGEWDRVFTSRGVTTLVYGALLIRRKTESRAAFTVRRQNGDRTNRAEMDWLLDWEGLAAGSGGASRVLDGALTAAPDIELRVVNRLQDGDWAATGYQLQAEYPFKMDVEPQPWMIYLLGKCDGRKTGRQLWQQLIDEEVIFPGTPLDQFAAALTVLVSGGFLHF
ncbi:MAG: class I SAM-dependent methyltransferase [Bryobacteraceae bacterium]